MDSEFILVKLRRETRERIREYGGALLEANRLKPASTAHELPSVDQCVARLLDQWERERARKQKKS